MGTGRRAHTETPLQNSCRCLQDHAPTLPAGGPPTMTHSAIDTSSHPLTSPPRHSHLYHVLTPPPLAVNVYSHTHTQPPTATHPLGASCGTHSQSTTASSPRPAPAPPTLAPWQHGPLGGRHQVRLPRKGCLACRAELTGASGSAGPVCLLSPQPLPGELGSGLWPRPATQPHPALAVLQPGQPRSRRSSPGPSPPTPSMPHTNSVQASV